MKVISKRWNSDSYSSLMEDFKLQPLKTRRTNQTKGVLQYLKPLLLYSLIHSPPIVIPTIRSFLLLLPKLIPTNHPFFIATISHWESLSQSLIDCWTPIAFKLGLKHLCSNFVLVTLLYVQFCLFSFFLHIYIYIYICSVSSSSLLFSLSWGGYLISCEFAI